MVERDNSYEAWQAERRGLEDWGKRVDAAFPPHERVIPRDPFEAAFLRSIGAPEELIGPERQPDCETGEPGFWQVMGRPAHREELERFGSYERVVQIVARCRIELGLEAGGRAETSTPSISHSKGNQSAIKPETFQELPDALEELVEDIAITEFIRGRISSGSGHTISGVEFLRSLGFDDIADEIEGEFT